ncbi:CU044_5270 family protein [Amycolatopsis lexingtonensis]|uniref:CU044_5270 family protein n=1 Tax=Amycolatopsis lexingtonensis TaxID=218822 RepID=UPI003F6E4F34
MREDNVRKIWSEAELDAALADLHGDVDDEDGLAFARASLMAAAGGAETPPRETRKAPWRWLAVAAAVVLLVGGLALVTSLRPSDPEPARPAATLSDLDRPLAPDEFRYAQKLTWVPEMASGKPVQIQRKVELWIPADPKGPWHRRTSSTGAVRGLFPGEVLRINQASADEYGPGGRFPGEPYRTGTMKPHWNTPFQNWLSPDAALVASLVPDRGTLGKRLQYDTIDTTDDGRRHSATESLTMVRMVLELGLAPKDIRFALRDALTDVEGLFETPGQTPDGRPATVIVAKDTGQHLYLDPTTAQLLAWDFPPGTPTAITPLSTTQAPPSSVISPPVATTSREAPLPPELKTTPETVYSYAITRTSG